MWVSVLCCCRCVCGHVTWCERTPEDCSACCSAWLNRLLLTGAPDTPDGPPDDTSYRVKHSTCSLLTGRSLCIDVNCVLSLRLYMHSLFLTWALSVGGTPLFSGVLANARADASSLCVMGRGPVAPLWPNVIGLDPADARWGLDEPALLPCFKQHV